jgi:putative intracellular protease/amidase
MKDVVLYAIDTMADWEYGYLTAGLSMAEGMNPGRFRLLVAADGTVDEVRTMGGLRVHPDLAIGDVDPSQVAALILPGANTWAEGHEAALNFAKDQLHHGTLVAAICGATLGLARAGLLNDRAHTSNAPEFLTKVGGYAGAQHYKVKKTVKDGNLVTAPATAPLDFARAVFESLEVFPQPVIDAWYGLYTTGDRSYYDQLVGAGR